MRARRSARNWLRSLWARGPRLGICFRSQVISGEIWRKIAAKRGKTRKSPDMMKAKAERPEPSGLAAVESEQWTSGRSGALAMANIPTLNLNDGRSIPQLGMGV